MNCYLHEQKPAVGTCVGCGKFICEDCDTDINGKKYCKKCVADVINENNKKLETLESKVNNNPMVFMNAGGGSSSSSSAAAGGGSGGIRYVCYKSKVVAGILGIFLGSLGIHKFYMGQIGLGIIYLLFCWTTIPIFIGFIEGIIYLCTSDEAFNMKYGKPVSF